MIRVSKEEGEFDSISEALRREEELYRKAGEDRWQGDTIEIGPGVYRERPEVKVPKLTIRGQGADRTIITASLYARMPSSDIGKLGTFRTWTFRIDADEVRLSDLTIENASGSGEEIGQAVALSADGDRLCFENLKLSGCQDTLFTGPLPMKEREKRGFIGPKEFEPRRNGRQLYRRCRIEGDIDFIFGSASAYFEECELYQKRRIWAEPEKTADRHFPEGFAEGYLTAASTPESQSVGYIFNHCSVTGDPSLPDGSCYLGRPWRDGAKVVIMNSFLGAQIHPDGFSGWNCPVPKEETRYAEFQNFGPGAVDRPAFVRILTEQEAENYSLTKFLSTPTEQPAGLS